MIANKIIEINKAKWDRCTRNGSVRIGNKNLFFHTFAPSLQNRQDVEIYLEILRTNSSDIKNAKMMTYRLFDIQDTIVPLLNKAESKQINLYNKYQFQHEQDVIESIPIMIDPCIEYTWYTYHMEELSQIHRLPKELKNLITRLTNSTRQQKVKINKYSKLQKQKFIYEKFWHDLYANQTGLTKVITRMLELQYALSSDIGLPPVPPLYGPELFDVVKQINRISQAVWEGDNCATYVVLAPEMLNDEAQINLVMDYLKNADSKFIVIKMKNLELYNPASIHKRNMFKMILKTINDIKKSKNDDRVFVLLEAGLQFYPALAGGFDIVSTNLRALDNDGAFGRSTNGGYGGWYDPKHLVTRPFQDVKKMFKINNKLPCRCPACSTIHTIKKRNVWNKKRREHYIYSSSNLADEINTFVDQQRIELAGEKLSKSALANFKHMLPFPY